MRPSTPPHGRCGLLIPFLPDGLHPDAETLLNEAPDPYAIGTSRELRPSLQLRSSSRS